MMRYRRGLEGILRFSFSFSFFSGYSPSDKLCFVNKKKCKVKAEKIALLVTPRQEEVNEVSLALTQRQWTNGKEGCSAVLGDELAAGGTEIKVSCKPP